MSRHTIAEIQAALAWQTSSTRTGKAARDAIEAMGYVAGRYPAPQLIARADYLSEAIRNAEGGDA